LRDANRSAKRRIDLGIFRADFPQIKADGDSFLTQLPVAILRLEPESGFPASCSPIVSVNRFAHLRFSKTAHVRILLDFMEVALAADTDLLEGRCPCKSKPAEV